MIRALYPVLAAAALAAAPAQTQPAPAPQGQTHQVALAGLWHIMSSATDCTAMYKFDDADLLVALIYPRPGKKPDAALMIDSTARFFGDAVDGTAYPVRLILTDDNGFDTSWHDVVPTGFALTSGEHGIRIAAPAQAFGDSLARAEAIRLEGIGRGMLNLEVKDMKPMVDALRSCATAP
jgi:hypothetical protein